MSNIPLNIDWQQILLHLFNFAILCGGLYFLLYGPVKKFMDARTEAYRKMDEEAKQKIEKAEAVEAEYQERLGKVDAEIDELRAKAAKDAELRAQASVEQARKDAEKVIADAKNTAMQERKKILDSAQKEIINMAVEATEKILADDAYEQFLNAAERSAEDAGR